MTRSRKRLDEAEIARQAIAYLVQTDLALHWGFSEADPPSPEIMHLLMPYFADGEIELTTSALLCDYLVSRLREEYPPILGRRILLMPLFFGTEGWGFKSLRAY
jgi:hypothetical protein